MLVAIACAVLATVSYGVGTVLQAAGARRASSSAHLDVTLFGRLARQSLFLAGLALWFVNVFIVFPILGRGMLGYRMPQGWMSASLPLLVSHWMFARGLQFQDRRL